MHAVAICSTYFLLHKLTKLKRTVWALFTGSDRMMKASTAFLPTVKFYDVLNIEMYRRAKQLCHIVQSHPPGLVASLD